MHRIFPVVLGIVCIFFGSLQESVQGEDAAAKTSTVTIESKEFTDYVAVILDTRDLQKEEKELSAKSDKENSRYEVLKDRRFEASRKLYGDLESSSLAKAKDPVAAFAEAKKIKNKLDEADKELEAARAAYASQQDVHARLNKVRDLLKSDWIAIWRQRHVGEKIADELGIGHYAPELEVKIRALEKQFVEEVKLKAPNNKELQIAISRYERAYSELNAAEGYSRKFKVEYDKYPSYSNMIGEQEAIVLKANEILAKPANAENATAYQKVQEEMRLLEEKREAADLASHTYHLQEREIMKLQDQYEKEFQQVVLAQ